MRRRLAVVAAAVAAVAAISGTALAVTGTVKTYSGCLVSKDGVIIKIREGETPTSPCTGGMVQVSFSGGDVTAITAGTGLQGGGTNGDVTLTLAPSYRLPQTCTTGQVAKWNGTGWLCADDANSTYTAGTGLDLTDSEFSVEPGYRLPQAASTGDSVVRTNGGTWTAEQFALAGETCPSGQFAKATTATGGLTCAAPPAGSSVTYVSTSLDASGIPDDGVFRPYASLNPGAGTYVIMAKAVIFSEGNVDQFRNVTCRLRADSSVLDQVLITDATLNAVEITPLALLGATPITTGFAIECRAGDGADGVSVQEVRLIGVKLG